MTKIGAQPNEEDEHQQQQQQQQQRQAQQQQQNDFGGIYIGSPDNLNEAFNRLFSAIRIMLKIFSATIKSFYFLIYEQQTVFNRQLIIL